MEQTLFSEIIDKYFARSVGKIYERYNDAALEPALLHLNALQEEYTPNLSWNSTTLNHSIIAADVVEMDTPAPLQTRDVIMQASGALAKLSVAFRKGETDIANINIMMARGGDEATLAAKVLDDVPKAIKSIKVRNEILFEQALSTGYCLVESDKNDGKPIRVNFGFKDENFFKANYGWDTTSATPLDDIQQLFDAAQIDGVAIGHVWISRTYFQKLRSSSQGKTLAAAYNGIVVTSATLIPVPSKSAMLEALKDEFGAEFHVVEGSFKVKNSEGKQETITPWETANIVATPSDKVGRLVYGTLAEETNPAGATTYEKAGYILVSKYAERNPLSEYTIGQAMCLPVIDDAADIYVLTADKAKNSSTTGGIVVNPGTGTIGGITTGGSSSGGTAV